MIDYEGIVAAMVADNTLAVCFYTKEQCRELRNAIIRAVGPDCIRLCWHAEDDNDREMAAFRLHMDGDKWAINGAGHSTYRSRFNRHFIDEYEVVVDNVPEPPNLTMLFGGAL